MRVESSGKARSAAQVDWCLLSFSCPATPTASDPSTLPQPVPAARCGTAAPLALTPNGGRAATAARARRWRRPGRRNGRHGRRRWRLTSRAAERSRPWPSINAYNWRSNHLHSAFCLVSFCVCNGKIVVALCKAGVQAALCIAPACATWKTPGTTETSTSGRCMCVASALAANASMTPTLRRWRGGRCAAWKGGLQPVCPSITLLTRLAGTPELLGAQT